jgi:hypothetical protein
MKYDRQLSPVERARTPESQGHWPEQNRADSARSGNGAWNNGVVEVPKSILVTSD